MRRITLFRLFGIPVRVHSSWTILAALVSWTLAEGYFPHLAPELSAVWYWSMAAIGVLILSASVILHEAAHALVGRRQNIPIAGITLFVFGGVAEMEREPPNARAELLMAAAGPAFSLVLGLLLVGCEQALIAAADTRAVMALALIASYAALVNLVLAVFNMIPAFPLDGGRVLRALLWHWREDSAWATRMAARTGSALGLALVLIGAASMWNGIVVGGAWWVVLGFFIQAAARATSRQEERRALALRRPVWRYMHRRPAALHPAGGWPRIESVSADAEAGAALRRMREAGRHHLLVTRRGLCVGVVWRDELEARLNPSDRAYTAAARTTPRAGPACNSESAVPPPRSEVG